MLENPQKKKSRKKPLEPEYFKDPNRAQDFLCTICHKVPHPDIAVEEVECGYIFCKECLKEHTETKKTCPNCDCKINNSQRSLETGNKLGYRILMKSTVYCSKGCSWSGAWKELDKHLAKCQEVLPCNYAYIGCSFKGTSSERKEHEKVKADYHLGLAKSYIEKKQKEIVGYVLGDKYTVSVHKHTLEHIEGEKWACDGRRIVGGCKSGFKGFNDTLGALRFRCDDCDYDLCMRCLEAYLVDQ